MVGATLPPPERAETTGEPTGEPTVYASRRERRAAEAALDATPAPPLWPVELPAAAVPPPAQLRPSVQIPPSAQISPSVQISPSAQLPPPAQLRPPAPARAATTATAPPRPRQLSRSLLSSGAMLAAGLLAIGMTLPSNALLPPSAGDQAAMADVVSDGSPASQRKQTGFGLVDAAAAAPTAAARDGYTGQSYAELQQAAYQAMGSGYAPGYVPTTGSIRWPFPYSVSMSSGFGEIRGDSIHKGTDFNPGVGSEIHAIADGVVTWVGWKSNYGYGYYAVIQHTIGGITVESLYGHMIDGSSGLYPGQSVKAGDIVGLVGDTGYSFGPHLHLEIHLSGTPVDPYAWLTEHATNF